MRGSSSLQSTVQGFYMDSTSSSGKKTIYGYETNFISPLSVSDTSIGLSGNIYKLIIIITFFSYVKL